MSVSQSGASSAPGITPEHIESVRVARAYLQGPQPVRLSVTPAQVDNMLADLLAAYDAIAARVAWIVASHGEES